MAILLLLLFSAPVAAQHIIIDPPFPPPPPGPPVPGPIQIEEYRVEAHVDGPAAQVRVTQLFRNQSGQTVEGRFVFPLPPNAAVSDLQMRVDDQVLEGRLLPADEARAIYEQIVRQQRDPALLQYLGQGLFQTNVFPIPPGATRTVQFQYSQLVEQSGGLYHFRFPLRAQPAGMGSAAPVSLEVELVNQPGLRTLYSPNHEARVERTSDTSARVTMQSKAATQDPAFDLFWGVSEEAIGINILSYRPAGEDGFFVLLASPQLDVGETEVVARDIVVVLDVSGSMEGEKMEQARRAVDYIIDHLNAEDRFNIISFSTGVRLWSSALQPVNAETKADAHVWVSRLQAGGSTDINRGLLEGLAQLQTGEGAARPAYLLFFTDGLPTQGETDPWRILENARTNAPAQASLRLFTFGVGYDVNTQLLDTLSDELGGRSSYVLPEERIDEAVSQFYQGIQTPVLTNVTVDFGGEMVIDEQYPYPLPDLFAGEQLVVVGRYREGGRTSVTLRGEVNEATYVVEYPGQELVQAGGEPFVARIWANRKIGVLMEEIRRNGPDPELVDAIVDLSLQYGIVTPYTAYLVEEPNLAGPVMAPEGVPAMPGGEGGMGGGAPAGAPADMRPAAEAYAAAEAARMAEMPASGAPAVEASEAQNDFQAAVTVEDAEQMRYVSGKTFVRQGMVTGPQGEMLEFWVDTAYRSEYGLSWVLFGSDAYFALAQDPAMAAWLSLSPEMVVVLPEGQAIRITTSEAAVSQQPVPQTSATPVAPLPTPAPAEGTAPSEETESGWGAFWSWLWDEVIR
ncbi:MAG TPA: VIT domain-containing protein [Caldilineaceae bacterium]|nr:VIT domain-containing protein [Caldilineaceae bacterium]